MKDYFLKNKQFFFILLLWVFAGSISYLGYIIVLSTIYIMLKKKLTEEILMGFFFILILSDSYIPMLAYTKELKNIYMCILIIHFMFKTNEFYPLTNLYKIFLPFFLFSFITIVLSIGEAFFVIGVQKTISYFFVFLIVPNYLIKLYRESGKEFLRRFILFCFFILVTGFILNLIAPAIANISTGRYRGLMGNPNGIGLFSVLVFLIFSIITENFPDLFSKNEKRLIYASCILSILLSGSRSSLIAVLLFYLSKSMFKKSSLLGFTTLIAFLLAAYFINLYIVEIITSLKLQGFLRVDTLENGSGRYIAWEFAWHEIQHNFFMGKGWGYDEYYMHQHYLELSNLGHQGGVHNSFLSFWMDQGLIGVLLFIRSFTLIFIKSSKNTRAAFPLMITIVFTAIFESWLVASLSAFAFLALFIFTFIANKDWYENVNQEVPYNQYNATEKNNFSLF